LISSFCSPLLLLTQPAGPRSGRPTAFAGRSPKVELLNLLADVPNRGLDASPDGDGAMQVERLVDELEEIDPSFDEGWMLCADLEGTWRLSYTSSRTFRANGGLLGLAGGLDEVSCPELLMHIDMEPQALRFEEQLVSGAAGGAGVAIAECTWTSTADEALQVTPLRVRVGERAWAPVNAASQGEVDFDRDKAIRVLCAVRPVYLDESLLVLRGLAPGVVFIFGR